MRILTMPEHSYSKSIECEEYELNNSNLSENVAATNGTESNTYIFKTLADTNGNLSSDEMNVTEIDDGNCIEGHSFHSNGEHKISYNTCDIDITEGESKIEVEETNIYIDNDREEIIPSSRYLSDKLKMYVKEEMKGKVEFIDVQVDADKVVGKYTKTIISSEINDCNTNNGNESKLDIDDVVILAGSDKVVCCEFSASNCVDGNSSISENLTEKSEGDYKNLFLENSIPEDMDNINTDSKVINSSNNSEPDESSSDICEENDVSNTSNSDIDDETDKTVNGEMPEKNIDISDTNITEAVDDAESSEKESNISEDKVAIEDTVLRYTIDEDALPGKLVCEECNVEFEIFCGTCRMLSRILDSKAPYGVENRAKRTLPRKILSIGNESNPLGVFTSYNIPKGIIFGPLEGLEAGTTRSTWKLKGGRFVISLENAKNLNWMQFIRRAKSATEQNLVCFQFKGRLYYKSKRPIEKGNELLVFFGDAHSRSKNKAVETYLSPKVLKEMYKVYACTYCCIGMTSKEYLKQHKGVCPIAVDIDPLFVETVHCYHCRMFLNKEEHIEYHRDYCQDKHERLWQAQMISEKIIERRRNQAAIEVSGKRKKTKEIPQNKKKCVQCSSGIAHSHSDSS